MNINIKEPWQETVVEEQTELKRKYVKLIEHINSEEFYNLSVNEQKILTNQKTLIEAYLKLLSTKLYEPNLDTAFIEDYSWISLMFGFMKGGFFGSSNTSFDSLTKKDIEDTKVEEIK